MKINTARGKTEVMSVSRRNEEYELYMREKIIYQTGSYSYLGVELDAGNNREIELNARITKYTKTFLMMYPLLKGRTIPRSVKITIYKTILKPILLYGSECLVPTTRTKSKLQAAEMKVLRTIRGVTRMDRLRNEQIR